VSSMKIPEGAIIERRMLVITTAFDDATATVSATVKGTSPLELVAATDFKVKRARQYGNDDLLIIGSGEGGKVGVTVTPADAEAGAGYFMVWFSNPNT